jgi:hypothetical protein
MTRVFVVYRDVLGLRERAAIASEDGHVTILEAGRATLEQLDPTHAAFVDEVEVGRRVAGDVRIAFEVDDSATTLRALAAAGGPRDTVPCQPGNQLTLGATRRRTRRHPSAGITRKRKRVTDRAQHGWTHTFLNRRLSTSSVPLPPLVIEPEPTSEPRRRRKPVPAPKIVGEAPRTSVPASGQVVPTHRVRPEQFRQWIGGDRKRPESAQTQPEVEDRPRRGRGAGARQLTGPRYDGAS